MKYKTMINGLTALFGLTIVITIVVILNVYIYKDSKGTTKNEDIQQASSVEKVVDDKSQINNTPEYNEIIDVYRSKIRNIMSERFAYLTLEDFKRILVIKKDLKEDNIPNDRVVYSLLKDGRIVIGYFDKDTGNYVDIYEVKE